MAKQGPTLRAQWLGQQLREAREAAGHTLKDAGDYLLRDMATVSRFENARVPPRPGDVAALLNLYGIDDPAKREALHRLSRDIWIKGWWDGYSGHVAGDFIDYAWLEDRASRVRSYDVLVLPGIVQTSQYAEAAIRAADPDETDAQVEKWLAFRMDRHEILRRDDPPELSIVLDEALLRRYPCTAAQMRAQIDQLLDMVSKSNIEMRILPLRRTSHAAPYGAFQIFDQPEPYPEVAYAETLAGSLYVESKAVDKFVHAYDRLRAAALPETKSVALMKRIAKELT